MKKTAGTEACRYGRIVFEGTPQSTAANQARWDNTLHLLSDFLTLPGAFLNYPWIGSHSASAPVELALHENHGRHRGLPLRTHGGSCQGIKKPRAYTGPRRGYPKPD
jgi:hypothetical protein